MPHISNATWCFAAKVLIGIALIAYFTMSVAAESISENVIRSSYASNTLDAAHNSVLIKRRLRSGVTMITSGQTTTVEERTGTEAATSAQYGLLKIINNVKMWLRGKSVIETSNPHFDASLKSLITQKLHAWWLWLHGEKLKTEDDFLRSSDFSQWVNSLQSPKGNANKVIYNALSQKFNEGRLARMLDSEINSNTDSVSVSHVQLMKKLQAEQFEQWYGDVFTVQHVNDKILKGGWLFVDTQSSRIVKDYTKFVIVKALSSKSR